MGMFNNYDAQMNTSSWGPMFHGEDLVDVSAEEEDALSNTWRCACRFARVQLMAQVSHTFFLDQYGRGGSRHLEIGFRVL